MKRPWRLAHSLILLAVIGLLPLALIGSWGIATAIEQQRREVERSTVDLARALASAIDTELEATVSALRTLSYAESLHRNALQEFYAVAANAAKARPSWRGVLLTDATGKLLFSTSLPYGTDARVIDSGSLRRAIEEKLPQAGGVIKGPQGNYAFPVRVPVIVEGRLHYLLSAAIRPDGMLRILQQQNVPESWTIAVLDGSGNRVARSRDNDATMGTPASPELFAMLKGPQQEHFGLTRTSEGTEVFTGYVKLPRYGWSVAVGVPTAELKTSVFRTLGFYILGALVSLLLCAFFAVRVARRLVDDVKSLQGQALRVEQGQPVQSVESHYLEFQQMSQAMEAAGAERIKAEGERQKLLASLHAALSAAEDAGRAKDQFLAVLGHELRNPLAPMVGALHLLELKGDAGSLRERQIMQRQVDHLKRLVDDLLDVSRITQGKLELRSEAVQLDSVIERAVEAVAPTVRAPGGGITVNLPQSAAWVHGDATRLVQAVTNLLTNALRFDPSHAVTIELAVEENSARISVSDHGAGMNPQTLAQVFEPFWQAPQPLARSSGGLGLGLAIVRGIVERHHGVASARSAGLNQGSCFEIRLPTIPAPQTVVPLPAQRSEGVRGNIVVIDDNIDAAETAAEALRLSGHTVHTGHTGAQALQMVAELRPHIAILDIGLPDIDGFDLARAIRRNLPHWEGQLLALSGYGQKADKQRAREAGFALHLTKPADIEEMLKAIDMLLTQLVYK